jgi:amidase
VAADNRMEELSIPEIQAKLDTGELTTRRLAELYLARIESVDKGGPRLNSVIELNPDAMQLADTLDEERRHGKLRGRLHGVPILLKDNIDTADRMQTTAGSLALEGNHAARDAGIVERLRNAGALILGKTNLSEWANFRGKSSTSGWSSRGGLTRNPYALDRTACGSSSGSGAAVAANLCAAAIGTETDGSIICPSQSNGIVGIKPTLGLVSRSGIIPIAASQDTAGPMARTVEDAAILLAAIAGSDPRDRATRPARRAPGGRRKPDYERYLKAGGLKGARIGVARNLFGSDKRIEQIAAQALDAMKRAGAILIDPVDLKSKGKFSKTELEVLWFEFKDGLNRYLAGLGPEARVKSMQDVIRFNEEHKERVLQYFGQEHFLAAEAKMDLKSKKYIAALKKNHRLTREHGIDLVMKKHKLDALVCPSGGAAWMIDLVNGDQPGWDMESTSFAAVAGYPHVTVPAGFIFGLPVGISFFGRAWSEPTLIRLAYSFEQVTRVRRPPEFLPTARLEP